ncbi:2-oxoglutarate and iron-dependent oxygenase domain-containing protein 3-like [Lineus longissimus]|uniref:2-oxoglutarate and iron-dependent oxygenase domain-containing protein 3-like n=1 Tax=Lineus longissimus TaxID=88925 RepID=UPI002B4E54F0
MSSTRIRGKKQKVERNSGKEEENDQPSDLIEPQSQKLYKRIIIRIVLVVGSLLFVRFYLPGVGKNTTIASSGEIIDRRHISIECSKDYEEEKDRFEACIPKSCGRVVMDSVITQDEAAKLQDIAKRGLALGGSNGGASILDLHSGALSAGDKFVDVFRVMENKKVFTQEDFNLYRAVKNKIHRTISQEFGIPPGELFLTKPTFFSRMTTKPKKTVHDEYWHPHVDKETYGSFHYTSLLYLADYGTDFTGGRFVFIDKDTNRTVEPRQGRLSFFTSGSENVHFVEKLESGTRYAITVSFTCDATKAIKDPVLR